MYNHLVNHHFEGCRLLAQTRDTHRERDVRLFLIAGRFDLVGVSDGTDSWLAPVVADPFACNIQRIMDELQAGGPGPSFAETQQRLPRRRVVLPETSPTGRVVTAEPQRQEMPRRRLAAEIVEAILPRRRYVAPTQL